ncbi:MAG: amino acid adenylation domain-containing protein, partial [Acidobacteriota bacterium]
NQLAHWLRSLGVGPETVAGILAERSLEMVIGLAAVLKSGGTYLPLDPSYPRERLAFMAQDSGLPVLLTQRRLAGLLSDQSHQGQQIIQLDADWPQLADCCRENPSLLNWPESSAYLIYTSGSTGRPKGAVNSHRAIVNRLQWMQQAYRLGPQDRVLQKTPFSFDVSVWEFFWPLIAGARLVMALPGGHRDSAYLADVIQREEVTTLHFVPSMLQVFLDQKGIGQCTSIRRVIASGEALPPALAERFFSRLNTRLHNLYGPTEAAIDVTFEPCRPGSQSVPIGRPIANLRIRLLDPQMRLAPLGVPSELYIGGLGLARGYLKRPGLTAEKFVPDPLSEEPGQRLYRTGDLARHLQDGRIDFLGRTDFQVKLRGFRIELGEIEAVLSQHPSVREAVVAAREDIPGSQRLAAYLVPRQGQACDATQLRDFLKERLPEHMIPSAFVALESLPLTPNGKVDRKALPAPDSARPDLRTGYAAARNQSQARLAEIWRQLLGLDQVGIQDNFFELGGDSILSIQMIAQAERSGLRLTPKQVFQHQTIAELAAAAGKSAPVEAEQGPVEGAVPLTPVQHWFFELEAAEAHYWNQSVVVEAESELEAGWLEEAVRHLLRHHDALRLRFAREEDAWRQFNAGREESRVFCCLDLSALPQAECAGAFAEATRRLQGSLSLSQGPLMRMACFRMGQAARDRLVWIIHHLAVDGVSWRILLQNLQTACRQLRRGQAVHLPPKTTSYKAWAERLSQQARSEAVQSEADYWLAETRKQAPRLPVDHQKGANSEASTDAWTVSLSEEETSGLLQEVPRAYRTRIEDVLLTALARSLADWAKSGTVLVDLEGHGREDLFEDVDLSRTVGWFTAVYPLLLQVEESGPGPALKSVKEQLRGVPGRGLGYGLLRYLGQGRETARRLEEMPQAEVSFNYLG